MAFQFQGKSSCTRVCGSSASQVVWEMSDWSADSGGERSRRQRGVY